MNNHSGNSRSSQTRMERKKRQLLAMMPAEREDYKARQKEYQHQWYLQHREEHKARAALRRKEATQTDQKSSVVDLFPEICNDPSREVDMYVVNPPTSIQNFTLGQWIDEWMETYKSGMVSPRTTEIYKAMISIIGRQPESSCLISSITEQQLQKMLNRIQQEKYQKNGLHFYSKSTLSKVRIVLQQSMLCAYRLKLIPTNPAADLLLPTAETKKVLPLTNDQQKRVERACAEDALGHLLIFLLRTGLRRTELMNLQWQDYDAHKETIYIRISKTPAGVRTIYLLTEAKQIIESQPKINDYIFNSTKGTPITATVLKRLYERIRSTTGITTLTNHVCRHTFVTRLCEKGVSAKAIAQIIGHAKTDYVLDIYAKLEQKELRKAIYALEPDKDKANQIT